MKGCRNTEIRKWSVSGMPALILHSTLLALRLTCFPCLGHVIHAAGMEGVAFTQSHDSQSEPLQTSVLMNGFATIGGTRRIKPATISQQRRDRDLVNPNQYVEYSAHGSVRQPQNFLLRITLMPRIFFMICAHPRYLWPVFWLVAPLGRPVGSILEPDRPTRPL